MKYIENDLLNSSKKRSAVEKVQIESLFYKK